jgi:Flp pilus assembly protein TadD
MLKTGNIKNPNTIEVNSIMSLHNVGEYENAFDKCMNLLIKYPNSPLLYNILGVINVGKSDFTNAIYSYLYAIKIKPNYAQAFNNLAILLKKLGEINLAVMSYVKAINLKPNYTQAYNNIGLIYLKINEIQKSKFYFDKAYKIDTNNEIINVIFDIFFMFFFNLSLYFIILY